jgi:MFS family permease
LTAAPLHGPGRDVRLLFTARTVRLFAYGFLSVILALYLASVGLDEKEIGLLFTFTLLGDAVVSLWITTNADRLSRKRMLLLGAALMTASGLVFALTSNIVLLAAASIVGVISPSGKEIGPFLSIEQAALSQLTPGERRTGVFAWYNLAGSAGTAVGALAAGGAAALLAGYGVTEGGVYRALVFAYGACGLLLIVLFLGLSPAVEARTVAAGPSRRLFLGLHKSKGVVFRLSALFGLDAFAGGFIVQSLIAYWFYLRFGTGVEALGGIFFAANVVAAVSALLAARIAKKIGLVNTMVVTHLPSNLLLILVPLMPTLPLAAGVLLLRFTISQMDVPTRQSYTMAVVEEDERSAASGVTTIARSVGASVSPALAGLLMASPALLGFPFFIAGGVKIVYDLLLYHSFRKLKPDEESAAPKTV